MRRQKTLAQESYLFVRTISTDLEHAGVVYPRNKNIRNIIDMNVSTNGPFLPRRVTSLW